MLSVLSHFATQSMVLATLVGAIFLIQTLAGGWIVFAFFPRRDAMRWPIYGPIAGMAFLTAVGLPLSMLGLPMSLVGPTAAIVGTALTIWQVSRLRRLDSGRRVLRAFVRRRGIHCLAVFTVVIAISTWILVGRNPISALAPAGSGDYGAYWILADYLQHNGATLAAYESQDVFRSSVIVDHISLWARLGSMVYLAAIGTIIAPAAIQHVLIPAVVGAMILMLGLAQCWLDRERPAVPWLLAAVVAHPFVYFLLYFSYLSQSFGIVLVMTALLLADRADGPLSRHVVVAAVLAGAMLGCAALHYSSAPITATVFAAVTAVIGFKRQRLVPIAIAAAAMLVIYGFYLPSTLRELRYAASAAWGWDWTALIGPYEYVGWKPVLGYEMPEHSEHRRIYFDLLAVPLLLLLVLGLRRSRLKPQALTIVGTTVFMASVALVKYVQHVGRPTHTFVKVLSTFTVFILLLAALPLGDWLGRLAKRPRMVVVAAVIAGFFLGQLGAIWRREPLRLWYTGDLITLTRRQLQTAPTVQFGMRLPVELSSPVVRNMSRVTPDKAPLPPGSVRIVDGRTLSPADSALVVDRQGWYAALRETPAR